MPPRPARSRTASTSRRGTTPARVSPRTTRKRPRPSSTSGSRCSGAGERLEHRVAAVDDEGVAGVIGGGVAGQVDGDAGEILGGTPAAYGHPRQDLLHELVPSERALRHGRVDPAGD